MDLFNSWAKVFEDRDYYSGSGPETAEIALFLGDGRSVRPRIQVLDSSGDSETIIVFDIDVSENDDGKIEYPIQSFSNLPNTLPSSLSASRHAIKRSSLELRFMV